MNITQERTLAYVPDWLVAHRPSERAMYTYLGLSLVANRHHQLAATRQALAEHLGVGLDTFDRAVGELVGLGALEVEWRKPTTGQITNVYRVMLAPSTRRARATADSAAGGAASPAAPSRAPDSVVTSPVPTVTKATNNTATTRASKKFVPALTDDERAKLHARWDTKFKGPADVDERIAEAMVHKAANNYSHTYLYVNGWLRREHERVPVARTSYRNGYDDGPTIKSVEIEPDPYRADPNHELEELPF